MNEENPEKLLSTVDGADIAQSIKNFPANAITDQEGGEKVTLSRNFKIKFYDFF